MNKPSNYEYSFTPAVWPMSFDEVLGEREICIAFDYEAEDRHDMIKEGIHMAIFARHDGDDEWEDVSHLTSAKEDKDFVQSCFDYLEITQ
jgi:hypothetical protein